MDPITIGLLSGAALGFLKNQEAARQNKAMNMAAAEQTRYSPWTNMEAGKITPGPSMMGDVASGALSGAMFGQKLQGTGITDTGADTDSAAKPVIPTEEDEKYSNIFGGQDLSSRLGQSPWMKVARR